MFSSQKGWGEGGNHKNEEDHGDSDKGTIEGPPGLCTAARVADAAEALVRA